MIIKNNIDYYENLILTIIYTLGLSFSLCSFIWNINIFIKINVLLSFIALFILGKRNNRKNFLIYFYIVILIIFFLFSSFYVNRFGWRLLAPIHFIISGYGFSMILLRKCVFSWSGYFVFYALASYFISLILLGYSGDQALKWSSSNNISVIMLISCISLYIILDFENREIDLIPAILTLIISIWGIGRGGIISSFILFFGLLFIKFKNKAIYLYLLFLTLIMLCVVIYIYSDFLIEYAINNNYLSNAAFRFIERGDEFSESSARSDMWQNYFNNLDLQRLFFGANVEKDPWDSGVENSFNYHNSFINLHLQTGLVGLITIFFLFTALVNYYKKNKLLFLLLLVLITRSLTDTMIFFGRYDFIPFFFIFTFINKSYLRDKIYPSK
jgi:hypothetical protein